MSPCGAVESETEAYQSNNYEQGKLRFVAKLQCALLIGHDLWPCKKGILLRDTEIFRKVEIISHS